MNTILFRTAKIGIVFLLLITAIYQLSYARASTVILESFSAIYRQGQVLVQWETAAEPESAGFYVLRSNQTVDGFVRLGHFIPSQGDGIAGASYQYYDESAVGDLTYYYQLESIDYNHVSEFYGPVPVRGGKHQVDIPLIWLDQRVLAITPGPDLLAERGMHTAASLLDGRILLVGGSQGGNLFLDEAEIFDPATQQISQTVSLHTARHQHTATQLLDGRVLVVGGYNISSLWLSDAEIYDPQTNIWTVVSPIHSHGVSHTATRMLDGRVLVVGGCIADSICTEQVEIFDPQTNSWSEAQSLPSDRASHTAILLNDGRVLVAGGMAAAGAPAGGDALLYHPLDNTWNATGPMIRPGIFAQSVLLADGRVLVAGGVALEDYPSFTISASAEIYDPTTYTWTAAADLNQARFLHTLMLLPYNRILAIGGARDWYCCWNANSFVQEIETYDPIADQWNVAGLLPQPGAFATASLLDDSSVWVAGGQTDGGFLSGTWIISILTNENILIQNSFERLPTEERITPP
jgi:hypothetical protein